MVRFAHQRRTGPRPTTNATNATIAARTRIVRTESSSDASTVSMTAVVAALDWRGLSEARYWFRPTLAAISRTAIDTASPDRGMHEAAPPVLGQQDGPREDEDRHDREQKGEVVEEPDPPLQLGELIGLEEHVRGPGVVRDLVEHRQAAGGELLLRRLLHLGQIHRDLPVGGLERTHLLAQQQVVDLLVRLAQRPFPQVLELLALHQSSVIW